MSMLTYIYIYIYIYIYVNIDIFIFNTNRSIYITTVYKYTIRYTYAGKLAWNTQQSIVRDVVMGFTFALLQLLVA